MYWKGGMNLNTRFYNAKILIDPEKDIIFSGELHIEGDRIKYVGDKNESNLKFNREINLNGNLIIPGFKNAHTHSPMTFLRSFADDLPLYEWLNNRVFPMEARLKDEHIYTFTKIALLEYISGGTTSCFDMYFGVDNIARACEEYGFRMVLCGAINDFSQSIDELEGNYLKYNKEDSLVSYRLGFHAEYTTSYELLKEISLLAKKYKAPVYTHISETKNEVDNCIAKYGKTPVSLLDSLGIYDYGGGGFHCTYFNENDIMIFKEKNLWAVTNPSSNLKLASGIAPIQKFMDNGINIAIGTDGPASNNSLNMFKEMYLTSCLQKYLLSDSQACQPGPVLKMATQVGAMVMGLNECVSLNPGMKADLCVIDLNRPNMRPINNIIKNIVYSGSDSNILMTMINGKILYENGIFYLKEDIERLYSLATKYMLDFSR